LLGLKIQLSFAFNIEGLITLLNLLIHAPSNHA
jgi:hypothetical protein